MENTRLILLETNIIIEYFKDNKSIIHELKKIGEINIAISEVTAAELIYGAFNKSELKKILETISTINKISIDTEISSFSISLMTGYSLTHKLSFPDALIAATAIKNNMPLFTLNKKDFKYLDVKLYE